LCSLGREFSATKRWVREQCPGAVFVCKTAEVAQKGPVGDSSGRAEPGENRVGVFNPSSWGTFMCSGSVGDAGSALGGLGDATGSARTRTFPAPDCDGILGSGGRPAVAGEPCGSEGALLKRNTSRLQAPPVPSPIFPEADADRLRPDRLGTRVAPPSSAAPQVGPKVHAQSVSSEGVGHVGVPRGGAWGWGLPHPALGRVGRWVPWCGPALQPLVTLHGGRWLPQLRPPWTRPPAPGYEPLKWDRRCG